MVSDPLACFVLRYDLAPETGGCLGGARMFHGTHGRSRCVDTALTWIAPNCSHHFDCENAIVVHFHNRSRVVNDLRRQQEISLI